MFSSAPELSLLCAYTHVDAPTEDALPLWLKLLLILQAQLKCPLLRVPCKSVQAPLLPPHLTSVLLELLHPLWNPCAQNSTHHSMSLSPTQDCGSFFSDPNISSRAGCWQLNS